MAAPGADQIRERFAQEGEALAMIVHPNVVRVHDVGSVRRTKEQPIGSALFMSPVSTQLVRARNTLRDHALASERATILVARRR